MMFRRPFGAAGDYRPMVSRAKRVEPLRTSIGCLLSDDISVKTLIRPWRNSESVLGDCHIDDCSYSISQCFVDYSIFARI